ncbi:hypothetical protein DH2020_027170 [Rehmannia glutinosa]|uniref:Uncharacterized protein n=1 Tax=Rehmannia glutinosa TaxID=99300 RepID=A0ABR0VZ34_REHGL
MKGKGARLVKQIISVVSCVTKSKCMAIRNKTDAMKARIMITALTVLSKKKSISAKINDAMDHVIRLNNKDGSNNSDEQSKAIVLYNNNKAAGSSSGCWEAEYDDDDDDDDKYPDLTHSLFDEEDKEIADLLDDPNASISAIDIVKNSKDENGESFNLENEIDEVADLFITKFHKRMRLQKLLSFKRYQQMMERSA